MSKRRYKMNDSNANRIRPISERGIHPILLTLRRHRQDRFISQERLAETLGYHLNTIRGAEIGDHAPSFIFIADYAAALGFELRLCPVSSAPTKPTSTPSTTSLDPKSTTGSIP